MNYSEKLKDSQGKAAEGLLATKIIDLMDKLRLGATDYSARRWIWELLQNAKDSAYDDTPVEVTVNLDDDLFSTYLSFSHNGQPFSSDNITSLIHQVTSKRRSSNNIRKKKQTGKYGTGFLSTHLLSEIVEVQGIVKEENLPYKAFTIELDRQATEYDDVLKSIKNSLDKITSLLDSEESVDSYDRTLQNTVFTYRLEEKKISIAEKGIADLHLSLTYTMAFTEDIAEVLIENQKFCYSVESREELGLSGLVMVTILENNIAKGIETRRKVAVMNGENTAIAFEILENEGVITLKPFKPEIPRLFCDFPLIGTESFPFPVIINSSVFNINEPRNGVYLTDGDDFRIKQNKALIFEAAELLNKVMIYAGAEGWNNLYEFAKINPAPSFYSDWLSKNWFDDNVLKKVREMILYNSIVDTNNGRMAIYDWVDDDVLIRFPDGKTREIREQIWILGKPKYNFPILSQIEKWSEVIWKSSLKVDLSVIAKLIEASVNIAGLQQAIGMQVDVFTWLNNFYSTMNLDIEFEDQVITDKFAIIPNQSNIFCKKSELKKATEVQDEIKDALEILGIPIRDTLLSENVNTGEKIKYDLQTEEGIINEINTLLLGGKSSYEKKFEVCDYLVTLFPVEDENNLHRIRMYNFSKTLYDEIGEKKLIKNTPELWRESDKYQLKTIVTSIAKTKNIKDFAETYNLTEIESIEFLDSFIAFLKENELESQLNLVRHPILPNQYGVFKIQNELSLDDGEIPEELKIVAKLLDHDIKDTLLEKRIYLELPETRTVKAADVANEISVRVMQATTLNPRPDYIKDAFRMLLLYFIETPSQAKIFFTDLHLNKHRLYDDEEIATNMKQAEDVKQLMEELEINSIEEMRNLLSQRKSVRNSNEPELEQITTEILASWGISTMAEYEALLGANTDSQIFRHYSVPTVQMLQIAHKLIERAKTNIIKYLDKHDDYELDDIDLIAPTTLAGITKKGLPIHVVFRPGDNKEVLFYYPSEKATLDLDNAELWIDDGENDPFHLTLGKILQSTGINRIPINGIN